jgi:hypothetical protein
MEMFCMPFGEIEERFTKSELVFMGWRSQEQHWSFKKKMKHMKREGSQEEYADAPRKSKYTADDVIPEGLPDEFFNEEGEVDLSRVTGQQAKQYFAKMGMPFPESGKVARDVVNDNDPVAQAYKKKPKG